MLAWPTEELAIVVDVTELLGGEQLKDIENPARCLVPLGTIHTDLSWALYFAFSLKVLASVSGGDPHSWVYVGFRAIPMDG